LLSAMFQNCYDRMNNLSRFVTFTNSRSMPSRWVLHLIYKVRRTTLLIVTFSFVRTSFHPTYLRRSFRSVSNRSWRFFAPFSSLSTASFRHPLVPFLRTRLKTRRPSVEWGFDGVYSTICSPTTYRASNFVLEALRFQLR